MKSKLLLILALGLLCCDNASRKPPIDVQKLSEDCFLRMKNYGVVSDIVWSSNDVRSPNPPDNIYSLSNKIRENTDRRTLDALSLWYILAPENRSGLRGYLVAVIAEKNNEKVISLYDYKSSQEDFAMNSVKKMCSIPESK